MQRSCQRGSSAGASGSDTSGVTTRHCGVSSAPAAAAAARRRGRSGGGGGGAGLGLLLHARGRRVFRGVGCSSSAAGAARFAAFPGASSSRFSGEAGEAAPLPPSASGMGRSVRRSASGLGLGFGWDGEAGGCGEAEVEAMGGREGAEEVRRVKMGFRVVEVRGEGQDGKADPGPGGVVASSRQREALESGWEAGVVGYLRFTSVFLIDRWMN